MNTNKDIQTKNLVLSIACMLTPMLLSAGSNMIHFQGRLTDSEGHPVIAKEKDGKTFVKFSIYRTSTAGAAVWESSEEQPVIPNNAGLFSTDIGPLSPGLFSQNNDLYLEISVRGLSGLKPLLPRQKLSVVPYAIHADFSAEAGTATTVADNSISAEKIKDGTVGADDLAPNSVGSNHIRDRSLQSVDLDTASVHEINIQDGAITTDKVKNESITADKVDRNSFLKEGLMIPPGAVFMFLNACPTGYSEITALQNRLPVGADTNAADSIIPNTPGKIIEGAWKHNHSLSVAIHYQEEQDRCSTGGWIPFDSPVAATAVAGSSLTAGCVKGQPFNAVPDLAEAVSMPPGFTVLFCQKN